MSFIFHHRPIIMVNILGKNLYNVITRYMLAGSIVGPGAFSFVTEIVQELAWVNNELHHHVLAFYNGLEELAWVNNSVKEMFGIGGKLDELSVGD
ncbi:hypothetical protein KSS87_004448 [Heliosperma pusillum]|nr:hypothetical protein KSS87_004448 [Heliosperma pusillum]